MIRRRYAFLPILVLVIGLLLPTAGLAAPQRNNDDQRQRVIVGLKPDAGPARNMADEMRQRHGGDVGVVFTDALSGFAMELPSRAIPALERDPRVAFVELDQIVQAFDVPTGVQRVEAPQYHAAAGNTPGSAYVIDVDIAIIDTGIASHPDLHVFAAVDCTQGSISSPSCKFVSNIDRHGHGTHVAGTAAGRSGGGAEGVAPGARLWSVKVLDDRGSGWMSWIIAGIDWVTARSTAIEVANMSLGCQCSSTALDTALDNATNAGVVFTVAAGNSGMDAAAFSPAKHPQVIAVSAMADFDGAPGGLAAPTCRDEPDDGFASFSNFGAVVDIAAPGVCITSTWLGGDYRNLSGTSMASPHVAGAAALYIVANNVPKNSSRWSTVLNGLQSETWSVPQNHACGFSSGKSTERMLMLADCTNDAEPPDPVADNPPTAAITSPTNGATVQGSVTIQVAASDDEDAAGTLNVQVRIGNGSWQTAAYNAGSGRYEWDWDTTAVANTDYVLSAQATDSNNATTVAGSITVTVANPVNQPPAVQVVSPVAGSEVSGSVVVRVNATDAEDPAGSLAVQIRIDDGAWQAATYNAASGYYERSWDTSAAANGTRTISARATDSNDAMATATPVNVTVANSTGGPAPDPTMHVASLTGSGSYYSLGAWRADVTIKVVDQSGNPVANAVVSGQWSTGASVSCSTGAAGTCTSTLAPLRTSVTSVKYSVTGVSHDTNAYQSSNNLVSSVTVFRP